MSFNEIPTRLDNIEKWFQIPHLAQHRKKRSEFLSTNRFHFKLIASSQVHSGRLSRDASIHCESLIDDRRKELNKMCSFGFSRQSSNINKRTLQRSQWTSQFRNGACNLSPSTVQSEGRELLAVSCLRCRVKNDIGNRQLQHGRKTFLFSVALETWNFILILIRFGNAIHSEMRCEYVRKVQSSMMTFLLEEASDLT